MRVLFLLLILLNLGYFTWQWQQPNDVNPSSGAPMAIAPDTNTLTLLSELHSAPSTTTEPSSGDSRQMTTPSSPPATTP